jgi:hypothetical protein
MILLNIEETLIGEKWKQIWVEEDKEFHFVHSELEMLTVSQVSIVPEVGKKINGPRMDLRNINVLL